jgi:phosphoribosylformylglycinamidine synthase
MMLAREFIRQGRDPEPVKLHIGTPIPFTRLKKFEKDEDMIAYLRLATYMLGNRPEHAPAEQIAEIAKAQGAIRESVAAADGLTACHDISDGGLACAIAEMAIAGETGAVCDLDEVIDARGCSGETALFGEGPGGFIVCGPDSALEALEKRGIAVMKIGKTGGPQITIDAAERSVSLSVEDAATCWRSLAEKMA